MSSETPLELPLGDRLLAQGWQQGAIFSAASTSFLFNEISNSDSENTIITTNRRVRGRERLILITQDCDIKSAKEEYVEALICSTQNQNFIDRIGNSARHFVVNVEQRLVAEARYRVILKKDVLLAFSPDSYVSSDRSLRFARWLGRRYDRPAIPDLIVAHLQQPLSTLLVDFSNNDPDRFAIFNKLVLEIRVSEPWDEEPPFSLEIIMITEKDNISEQEAGIIDEIEDRLNQILEPSFVSIERFQLLTPLQISLQEYVATKPLFFEHLTYQGDEIGGSLPLRAD